VGGLCAALLLATCPSTAVQFLAIPRRSPATCGSSSSERWAEAVEAVWTRHSCWRWPAGLTPYHSCHEQQVATPGLLFTQHTAQAIDACFSMVFSSAAASHFQPHVASSSNPVHSSLDSTAVQLARLPVWTSLLGLRSFSEAISCWYSNRFHNCQLKPAQYPFSIRLPGAS